MHRGLGEVQSFATGVGDLQRALVRVRLGGTRMTVGPAAEASAPRRRGGAARATWQRAGPVPATEPADA